MALALFDLDNTLLEGDSDYLWGKYLTTKGLVDGETYEKQNLAFYQDYRLGKLDIQAYVRFQCDFLTRQTSERLADLHQEFLADVIRPIIRSAGRQRLARHRQQGDKVVIITATNRFVTGPIARELGVDHLLATELEVADGRYTGRPLGTPCYQQGKVTRLLSWLAEQGETMAGAWFYSDSHNDLPLLGMVDHPVAVDPDEILLHHAQQHQWPVISLREGTAHSL